MDDIILNTTITLPASALKFKFTRSSGKGGQNVNKVSTKVELTFDVDEIVCDELSKNRIKTRLANKLDTAGIIRIVSQESRSQWQNKQTAIDKLVTIMTDASAEEIYRVATKPTRSSRVRRIEKKKKAGQRKVLRRKTISHDDE